MEDDFRIRTWHSSVQESDTGNHLTELFRQCPIPESELLSNLGLFIKRKYLPKLLFLHDLYRQILDVQVIVVEFGTRWGNNLALFQLFRGTYEPLNHSRKDYWVRYFPGVSIRA